MFVSTPIMDGVGWSARAAKQCDDLGACQKRRRD
jgi:hypothetical protein